MRDVGRLMEPDEGERMGAGEHCKQGEGQMRAIQRLPKPAMRCVTAANQHAPASIERIAASTVICWRLRAWMQRRFRRLRQ